MRIVLVSPNLPLPFGRADARWLYAVAAEMARRSVDVLCISCFDEGEDRVAEAKRLATADGFELRLVPRLLSQTKAQHARAAVLRPKSELAWVPGLQAALAEEVARGYDVLHVEHLLTAWATRGLPKQVNYLHHLELVDEERRPDLSLRERRTVLQLRRATGRLLSGAERIIVASSRLKREVARFRSPDDVQVVPVALDPTLYPLVPAASAPTVGVIGSMHWYPSRSAAERVLERLWPAIVAARNDATLLVAGWNADRYLGRYFPIRGASLLGPVDHPEDFFSQIAVLLYPPPRGSGMKIKVLEAMAYGVPVVTNAEGAEGLDIVDEAPVALAERDDDLVARVAELLSDPAIREERRRQGRKVIEEDFAPAPAVDRLLHAYGTLGLAS